ncbi:Crp/Fnr family transcriptional regulator [Hansschlegelia beijingensis]|uniref:Crp/Fnr family transcriptional regulator n=1 Tax=Hansschlegelia beijingensis TaxID=1133344 RepID=UPI0037F9FDF4
MVQVRVAAYPVNGIHGSLASARPDFAAHCVNCSVRDLSVCSALTPEDLLHSTQISETIRIPAGETVFIAGEPARSVFTIKSGTLRLYRILPDGRRQIVGFIGAGDFLGLALAGRYSYSADAVDDVCACRIDRGLYMSFMSKRPHLLRRLHELANQELILAHDHMVLLGRRSAEEKVAAFLLSLRERMRRLGTSMVTLALPMSRADLADYLGLTIETVCRVVSKLARQKVLLVVPHGVRLLDPRRLEEIGAS